MAERDTLTDAPVRRRRRQPQRAYRKVRPGPHLKRPYWVVDGWVHEYLYATVGTEPPTKGPEGKPL